MSSLNAPEEVYLSKKLLELHPWPINADIQGQELKQMQFQYDSQGLLIKKME